MALTRRGVRLAALTIVVGAAVAAAACDKDEEETVLIPIESPATATVTQDSLVTATTDTGVVGDYDAGPADPSDPGTKKDAGAKKEEKKDAGKSGGNESCLKKCSDEFSKCTTTTRSDGGMFALPDPTKCQAALSACQKACGG